MYKGVDELFLNTIYSLGSIFLSYVTKAMLTLAGKSTGSNAKCSINHGDGIGELNKTL
jgi:hypothetical protein